MALKQTRGHCYTCRPQGNFLDELDMLLSTFPEDEIQLDLIYTRHCSTDHVLVTPLHTSDHFLLTLNLNMVPDTTHNTACQPVPPLLPLGFLMFSNNLLDSNQSGFRSGHSTETALLPVVEALRLAGADSKSSVLLLLDLFAAFDTVNHQILLSTQLAKGISGTALQWFESYHSDRSFKVSWKGEVSKLQHLTTGVPQGSVLGPLLFSVYTVSLGSVIQKHSFSYHCYADDTQLYLSFHPDDPTITARISACQTDISRWMKDHHQHNLQLNLKTQNCLRFHQTHRFITISPSS
ncbi:putative RNA-directed DNA polymerase from transposon BS [Labeo rohita]|uniref:RNA-directed DNA polymerase from transposon BS n=1 Tax=Labeo rohita TaxID=84645 RepID=A0ABQ8MDS8_LABRO|nr:putative RNA-directed DNA polymerase from transposon BS [Labeo rohita]